MDLDEQTLVEIAGETGGKYYRATDTKQLNNIYDEIDQLEKTVIEEMGYKQYREVFGYFLFAELFFYFLS